jgi:hypothetical protein
MACDAFATYGNSMFTPNYSLKVNFVDSIAMVVRKILRHLTYIK